MTQKLASSSDYISLPFTENTGTSKKSSREAANPEPGLDRFERTKPLETSVFPLRKAIVKPDEALQSKRMQSLQKAYSGELSDSARAYFLSSSISIADMASVLGALNDLQNGGSALITDKNKTEPLVRGEIWKKKMTLLNGAIAQLELYAKPVEIDLEYYEFSNPEMLQKVRHALSLGAKVRVLMDPGKLEPQEKSLDASSFTARLRTVSGLREGMRNKDLSIAFFPNRELLNKDAIMHRKIFRVGDTVILTGMNAGCGSGEDVDCGLAIQGEGANRLIQIFREDMSLSQNKTETEIYGDQIETLLKEPAITLDREGSLRFLQILLKIPISSAKTWKEQAQEALQEASKKRMEIQNILQLSPEEWLHSSPESSPALLTPKGKELLAEQLREMGQFLGAAQNQNKMLDIEKAPESSGKERVILASKPIERQALVLFGIESAEQFIKIPAFVLTKGIVNALIAKKEEKEKQGKDFSIEIILDPGLYNETGEHPFNPNEPTFLFLQESGIAVKWAALERSTNDHDRKLHSKTLLSDKLVITGSTNFSDKGLRKNWEISGALLFDFNNQDKKKKLEEDFKTLYEEESLAPDIKAMAEKRFLNNQNGTDSEELQRFNFGITRKFLRDLAELEKQTGNWMDAFQQEPFNKKEIAKQIKQGEHPGIAVFKVVGSQTVKQIREKTPIWRKMQSYWIFKD